MLAVLEPREMVVYHTYRLFLAAFPPWLPLLLGGRCSYWDLLVINAVVYPHLSATKKH
jgi:hypothetical protein